MAQSLLKTMVNGFARQTGFTASRRTTEYLGNKVINTKSALRRKVAKFELAGTYKKSSDKLHSLIDVFYSEYIINDLPHLQVGTYLDNDIVFIDTKVDYLSNFMDTEEDQVNYTTLMNVWESVKLKAKKRRDNLT
jgi:hypothetical protein